MGLRAKMALGFGVVLIIMVSLGAFTVWNMNRIREQSRTLEQEYIAEIEMANDLERFVHQTMYDIREYALEIELLAGIPPERALTRTQKITNMNDIINIGNDVRSISAAAHTYQREMKALIENWTNLQEFEQQRNSVAEQVLVLTQNMVEGGMLETLEIAQDAVASLDAAAGIILIGLLLATGLGIVSAIGITRSVMKPIFNSVQMAEAVAAGDFSQSVDMTQRDEIGQLAQALQNMKTRISDVLEQINTLTKSVQEGTLTARGDLQRFTGGWQTSNRSTSRQIILSGFPKTMSLKKSPNHIVVTSTASG